MMMKTSSINNNKIAEKEQSRQDIIDMQNNATREISNEMAYKSKFVRKDSTMKHRQGQY